MSVQMCQKELPSYLLGEMLHLHQIPIVKVNVQKTWLMSVQSYSKHSFYVLNACVPPKRISLDDMNL